MATTTNLGLTIPVGGVTPGAANNTTPGTYPYIEAGNLALIDSECFSAANPVPTSGLNINANVPFNGYGITNASNGTYSGNGTFGSLTIGGLNWITGAGTAPPTSGTYTLGQWYLNTAPTAGGIAFWVCVAAGTPGTWRACGAISPT